MILATSLSEPGFPAHEILAAYRLRWQIKLAFKRLKSLLHIDMLRTRPQTARDVGCRPISSWTCSATILARTSCLHENEDPTATARLRPYLSAYGAEAPPYFVGQPPGRLV